METEILGQIKKATRKSIGFFQACSVQLMLVYKSLLLSTDK